MNTVLILSKDIWFFAALLVLIIGLIILFWCLNQLRRAAGYPPKPRYAGARAMAAPQQEIYPQSAFASPRAAEPPPAPAPYANETSVMYSMMEERMSDLVRRISSLEDKRPAAGDSSALLQPMMKRLEDLEKEIEKLRASVAQAAPAARTGDLTVLNEKISTMQRMMESLAIEPEAPKPS